MSRQYDVCVVGAGFSGFAAALASARSGLKTLLIEKNSDWGGTARSAQHRYVCGLYACGDKMPVRTLNGGIAKEIEEALRREGAEIVRIGKVYALHIREESAAHVFAQKAAAEEKLNLLFNAYLVGVEKEGSRITALRVRTGGKIETFACRAAIDAGSGALISQCGAKYDLAPADERQLAAYAFRIEGAAGPIEDYKIAYQLKIAAERGEIAPHLRFGVWLPGEPGRGTFRISVLPSDEGYDLQEIQNDARRVHHVLQEMSAFKTSLLTGMAEKIAEREGIRLRGREILTAEHVLASGKCGRETVKSAWPIEFWDPTRGPRYDYPADENGYEIPDGCLQSENIENLFAGGRTISADPFALASTRMTGTCLALGERAAHLAALYLKTANPYSFLDEVRCMQNAGIAFREKGNSITYAELFLKTDECARRLQQIGIKKYNRVGVFVPENGNYVVLTLAVLKLQAVLVPLPPASSAAEVKNITSQIQLDWLVFDPALHECPAGKEFPSPSGSRWAAVFFETHMPEQKQFESLNPAFIRFTSGTTGLSKGVVISHETIEARTKAAACILGITEKDKILWTLSMSYHFVVSILLFLRQGAEIILCEHGSDSDIAANLCRGDITFIYASPLQYKKITQMTGIQPENLGKVRMAVSTTAQLPPPVAAGFAARFGLELTPVYGIIEMGLPFINRSSDPSKRLSVGFPAPGFECELRDGKIYLKGPGMFDAYFSPWKTREQACPGGWFETGDMGVLENGCMRLLGRSEQVIQFMGMKIFPAEVESVLLEFPGIKEAFVYGDAHSAFGQIPKAKIVLEEGAAFSEDEARIFCYSKLSQYKVPKTFDIIPFLKKTESGKILINQ